MEKISIEMTPEDWAKFIEGIRCIRYKNQNIAAIRFLMKAMDEETKAIIRKAYGDYIMTEEYDRQRNWIEDEG